MASNKAGSERFVTSAKSIVVTKKGGAGQKKQSAAKGKKGGK